MADIAFYSLGSIPNEYLKYAVIAARYEGKWVFCRHRERLTLEMPGGHREPYENVYDTAKRELFEETGALDFSLRPICLYSVTMDGDTGYGGLFFAEIDVLGSLPECEITEIYLLDEMPDNLTYPDIQPHLMDKIKRSM